MSHERTVPPPQYFCEVISKTLNFVANSESSCTALIICLSFYRQLKIVCLDEYVCSGREEDSALLSSIPQVELVSSRQAIRHDTHDLYRELQTKLDSDYCTTGESLTLFIYDSHLFPPPNSKEKNWSVEKASVKWWWHCFEYHNPCEMTRWTVFEPFLLTDFVMSRRAAPLNDFIPIQDNRLSQRSSLVLCGRHSMLEWIFIPWKVTIGFKMLLNSFHRNWWGSAANNASRFYVTFLFPPGSSESQETSAVYTTNTGA